MSPAPWRQFSTWRRLAVGLVLLAAGCVIALGGSPAARPVFRGLALGWTVLLLAPARWRAPVAPSALRAPGLGRGLDVVTTNLAAFLVLGEVSLRVYGALAGHALFVSPGVDACRLAPNRDYGGLLTTNSHGYASREFVRDRQPGTLRLAALGDSFAVGVVPQQENFLSVLEQLRPDVEVYNFGLSRTGPREYADILRHEVWTYQPDFVLVCFFVGNDVTETLREPSLKRLEPEAFRLWVCGRRAWGVGREWLRNRTGEPKVVQPFSFVHLSHESFLEVEARRLAVCRPSQAAALCRQWEEALRHLDRIVLECRERGTEVGVLLIPDQFQVDEPVLREVMNLAGVPPADVDLDLPQRRLRDFLAERGVPCFDLAPVLRTVPDAYWPDDTHWNMTGNRVAGERLAAWLQEVWPALRGTCEAGPVAPAGE
jgi:lysophospholipase L1-like esterase